MSVHDLSNHDWSTFDADCLKAQGMERGILGCWVLDITASMMLKLRAAGIAVEDLYTFVYYGLPWEQREVDHALAIAKAQGGVKRIWIDCESTFTEHTGDLDTEAPGTSVADRIAITKGIEARIKAAGIEPCMYTGEFWWREKMLNTRGFRHLKLWLANYGTNDPANPRTPIETVEFGGWTDVAAHQYTSRFRICGRERDANYWFISEENGMTDDDLLAIFAGSEEKYPELNPDGTAHPKAGQLKPREERLALAKARRDAAAAGVAPSVREIAASAAVRPLEGITDYEAIGAALEKAGATIRVKGHGR